jgi:hypothetical protein
VTRPLLAAAALILAAACGGTPPDGHPPVATPAPPASSSPSPPSEPSAAPIHSPLLESDTGQLFTAPPGTTFLVRLSPSTEWGGLTATSGLVEEVHYRTDPGYREWQVTLPAKGDVTLTSTCPGCAGAPRFQVTIVVS